MKSLITCFSAFFFLISTLPHKPVRATPIGDTLSQVASYAESNNTTNQSIDRKYRVEARQQLPQVLVDCITPSGTISIEELCNFHCAMILCADRPNELTRNSSAASHNRVMSGQAARPYQGSDEELERRGLARLDPAFTSLDEYPFASTNEGGTGVQGNDNTPPTTWAPSMGFTIEQQRIQGGRLNAAFRRVNVNDGDRFELIYQSNTEFCQALNQVPPDDSICDLNNQGPRSPLRWSFHRNNPPHTKMQFLPMFPSLHK